MKTNITQTNTKTKVIHLAIRKLIDLMSDVNIAEGILDQDDGVHRLGIIGKEATEGFQADWKSMAEWREDIDTGQELIAPATKSRNGPWENSSNFKSPILMEARLKFGDRASQELLRGTDLVKASVMGRDNDGEKAKRIERVESVMDWQLIVESDTWVKEQDKLLYDVSCQGSIFKKTFYNASLGHNESTVIKYPNFAISQDARSLESAPRFTERFCKTPNEIQELILSGVWLDRNIELGAKTDQTNGNEAEQDKLTEFYEQETRLDLDEDGYAEPYVVTLHASSGLVVRIVAQYNLDDITVMDEDGVTTTVDRLILKDNEGQPALIDGEIQFKDTDNEGEKIDHTVIKIIRDGAITEYPFIADPKGKFLSVGFFHILGAYCQGINTTANQLIDAGTLANVQGGWLARGFRKKAGNLKIKPGQFQQTDINAQDLATGIRLYDFKEPSPTLFQLNQSMQAEAQRLSSTTDLSAALGQNTPATTALSIVQEQQEANGALILRIYRAMSRELAIWFKLNSKFMDPALYAELTDNEDADPMKDFSMEDMDIMPSMNPQNSSTIQRIQKANAQLSVLPQIEQSGGQTKPIIEGYLDAIGTDNIEQIYPELTEEQQKTAAAEQERIKKLNEELTFLPIKAQADIGEAERLKAEVKLGELQIKQQQLLLSQRQALLDMGLTEAQIEEVQAKTVKILEEAETESTKNAVSIVDAELRVDKANLDKKATGPEGNLNAEREITGLASE
jgi:chaperonin GroES